MDSPRIDLLTSFRSQENEWFQSKNAAPLQESSQHFGEVAFLLSGLKPAVLIQLPTLEWTLEFYHQVIEPSLIQHPTFTSLGLKCQRITRQVQSPEMSLQGCVLLWSPSIVQEHPQAELIQQCIDRICGDLPSTTVIPEHTLAVMLDLPGRLPVSEAEVRQMVEVSYWDGHPSQPSPTLLTAFAAQPEEIPAIQAHFCQYKDAVLVFGIQLKLHIQSLSDV